MSLTYAGIDISTVSFPVCCVLRPKMYCKKCFLGHHSAVLDVDLVIQKQEIASGSSIGHSARSAHRTYQELAIPAYFREPERRESYLWHQAIMGAPLTRYHLGNSRGDFTGHAYHCR